MEQTIEYKGEVYVVSKCKYVKVEKLASSYVVQGVIDHNGKDYLLVLGYPRNKAFLLR